MKKKAFSFNKPQGQSLKYRHDGSEKYTQKWTSE